MGSFDSVTWQALTLVLTVAGVVATVLLWRRRGPVAGLRALAVTLLFPAAYLTGTLRLLWEIGDAVVGWSVRLAFSPMVWLGVALTGVAVLLLVTAGVLSRRALGTSPRPRRRGPGVSSRRRQDPETASTPPEPGAGRGGDPGDDMADVEAILRRHGIS